MKIRRERQVFDPVVLVFEEREEFEMFWDIIDDIYKKYPEGSLERNFLIDISNSLSWMG